MLLVHVRVGSQLGGMLLQVQGVNMLGVKATHFLVFLAVLDIATRVAVSAGEQPSAIISFVRSQHSLRNSSAVSSANRECAVFD